MKMRGLIVVAVGGLLMTGCAAAMQYTVTAHQTETLPVVGEPIPGTCQQE